MTTLAQRVREARIAAGLNQSQLARRCDVKPQAIQKIESGLTERPRFILDLARELNVSPDWLMKGDQTSLAKELPADSQSSAMTDFASRVLESRRRVSLSIEQAARGIMTTQTWSEMEMGRYWPNPLELDFICGRLSESADWLVRGMVSAGPADGPRETATVTLHHRQHEFLPKE